ncbi:MULTISPECIES: nucleoside triphosphate pyrophosphohydrolase [Dethiosulfovibrio]|uniref:Nucleoside triphosphate pyrophosphohydrolase n=2 Tax=Dethiosulfovibrio TaxID=47054 RepID=A0ABS9EUD7_9BACT|nr:MULTISPECIES: nucleoside triphosphate pyrophosphohydrolase [Dethiosulfovibrio]MCF4115051.1 nucleoside triphosphate pyrophosphohydrolase [Dethiosulfovibrio russensis]MCF4143373.1 nucleoside triphosphate pyrophosphohydrolase [Dethiosulfovibrio marinus]MCF4145508.1 nucleoside triphosphate pyrophosphohydrolase [Dethiosulfovibrio acidaminovorans]
MKDDSGALFSQLRDIMNRLRAPGGCPWDRKQTYGSLRPHIIEEAYELVDAVDNGDTAGICEESGDLLLQVVFMGVIAEESGDFSLADIVRSISDKLIRRHPHVFGDVDVSDSDEVLRNWEQIKLNEKGGQNNGATVLSGVPKGLPPLVKAFRIQQKAASVGFDWDQSSQSPVFDKIDEEIEEVKTAMESEDRLSVEEEIGDVLFSIVNLARRLGVDPHLALERSNKKFIDRFGRIEQDLRDRNRSWTDTDLDELDSLWDRAKMVSRQDGACDNPM